jgi:dienelactone hydrolase
VTDPEFLKPFVLSTGNHVPDRHEAVDFSVSKDASAPAPAIVFVPGGPLPAALLPTQRDWPVYQGYGSAAADRGVVGVLVSHGLHDPSAYPAAAANVAAAIEFARADPRVDGDRVALWFFSGSGLLLAEWLRAGAQPPWLRCLAATYPVLAPFPHWLMDERFRPVDAVAEAGPLPIVLTRVGLERPEISPGVAGFVAAAERAGAPLEIVDVPDGHHGFDYLDDTDQSRAAITRALDRVVAASFRG